MLPSTRRGFIISLFIPPPSYPLALDRNPHNSVNIRLIHTDELLDPDVLQQEGGPLKEDKLLEADMLLKERGLPEGDRLLNRDEFLKGEGLLEEGRGSSKCGGGGGGAKGSSAGMGSRKGRGFMRKMD